MTEIQAQREGLTFTGIYKGVGNKELVKLRAKELRAKGYRAVMCSVKANPYARGQNTGITGYSVYVEPRYFLVEEANRLLNKKANRLKTIHNLKEKHEKEMQDLQKSFEKEDENLKDLLSKIEIAKGKTNG